MQLCIDCGERHSEFVVCSKTPAGHAITSDGHAYDPTSGECYQDCPAQGGHSVSLLVEDEYDPPTCTCRPGLGSGIHNDGCPHVAYAFAYCRRGDRKSVESIILADRDDPAVDYASGRVF